jgi:hypothetical protein
MYGYVHVGDQVVEQILKQQDADSRRYDIGRPFLDSEIEYVSISIYDADALNADEALGRCGLRITPDLMTMAVRGQNAGGQVHCDRWNGSFSISAVLRK